MRLGLEPVLFPEKDFHVLFRTSPAGQDPLPIVSAFLRRAWSEGLLHRSKVVGRVATPLGNVAVLEDGRRHAAVYVQIGEKTYASRYTFFPSLTNVRSWYRLAREMGDARFMDLDDSDADPALAIPSRPRGLRWCPVCEGINPLSVLRCIWCRSQLPPAEKTLPPAP